MFKRLFTFACLGSALLFNLAASASEPAELSWKFQKGDARLVKMDIDQKISHYLPMQTPMDTNTHIQGTSRFEIEGIDQDGNAMVRVTQLAFATKVSAPAFSFSYNSEDPQYKDSVFYKLFDEIIGKSYTFTLTKSGDVTQIEGLGALIDEIYSFDDEEDDEEDPETAYLQCMLQETFGEDALKEAITHSFSIFPQTQVSIGDSWTYSTERKKPAGSVTHGFRLISLDNNTATLDLSTTITTSPIVIRTEEMEIATTMAQTGKGVFDLELSTGWPLLQEIVTEIKGEQTIAPCEALPEGLSWPFGGTTKVSITFEK